MKKHSPNFFENLQEADTAKNNRATTFFWTVVLITALMLGFSVTKTNAQSSVDTIPVLMQVCDTSETKTIAFVKGDPSDNSLSIFRISKPENTFEALSVGHLSPAIIYGYQVTESYTHGADQQHKSNSDAFSICIGCTRYKTTYLNHKKQPLPDRLIVWMAIRRKER